MLIPKYTFSLEKTAHSGEEEPKIPNKPDRNDPFKKEEEDNDATRIRPGVHDPGKNDPTKIETPPGLPSIPSQEIVKIYKF